MNDEKTLKKIPTCQLVQELTSREGVERIDVEPYEETNVHTEGPAIVFVIID